MPKVVVVSGVKAGRQRVMGSPVFKDFLRRLGRTWQGAVTVSSTDFWKGRVHTLQVTVAGKGKPWPDLYTLRGPTVDVLFLITDGRRRYVALVEQYRAAAGGRVISNVAGGIEEGEGVMEAAERELNEELGLRKGLPIRYELLMRKSVLASPGITNERAYMAQATITLKPDQLLPFVRSLKNKRTGVAEEGEEITTRLVSVVAANEARDFIKGRVQPDAKTLLSFALAGL